jgi:ABC-type sugar transport system permease subunit
MNPPEKKPSRPWGGFGYLVLIVLAILVAVYVVWPIGVEVRSVFQRLTEAFARGS